MSQENVELVRRGIAAWNRRDLDAWLSFATPDIEWMPAGPAAVERTVYRGYDEVRAGIEAVFETWDVFECQETEMQDLGEASLWLGRVHMRGNASGVELDQEFAIYSVARDGRMALIHSFLSWQDALKAVGRAE